MILIFVWVFFFFSSRRRHTRFDCDWSSDVCSSDLAAAGATPAEDADAEGTIELRMKDPDRTVHVRRVVIPGLEGEPAGVLTLHEDVRSEERRVGKECRSRWSPYH